MSETFSIRHESAAGTFYGTISGAFTGNDKDLARLRDSFVAMLRASGWQVTGRHVQDVPHADTRPRHTPGPSITGKKVAAREQLAAAKLKRAKKR